MFILNLPPIEEVRDIVLDMMPVIAPDADPETVQKSIIFAENLVALFHLAKFAATTEAVLKIMLSGMISATEFADRDWH
ncbi:hypothetical protein ACIPF8_22790 [Collimonas sp. NPDC087041]|uniref:hypothetical protein n=1 Tax=Collimonas sp. NPDC087041 TaxID=3363960 RepID=UPI00381DB047